MRRFLAFWIVLTPACWVSVIGVSLVVFRHVDLTYATFAVLVTAPVLQALVLATVTAAPRARRLPLVSILREPLVVPVVVLDLVLLGTGWLWPDQPVVGLETGTRLHAAWVGTKLVAAGLFLLVLIRSPRTGEIHGGPRNGTGDIPASPPVPDPRSRQESRPRLQLALTGLALLLAGLQAFVPWIAPAVARLNPWNIRSWPTLFVWMASYGSLFIVLNGLLLRAGSLLRRHVAAVDFWMQTAVALNFCVGLIAVHGFFRLPYLVDPWFGLAWTAGSLAATAALIAAVLAHGSQSAIESGSASPRSYRVP